MHSIAGTECYTVGNPENNHRAIPNLSKLPKHARLKYKRRAKALEKAKATNVKNVESRQTKKKEKREKGMLKGNRTTPMITSVTENAKCKK